MVRSLAVFAGLQWLVMARAFLQAPGSVARIAIARGAFSSNPSSISSSPASPHGPRQRRGPMLRPLLAEAEASQGEEASQQPPQSTAIVAVEGQDNEGGPLKRAFRRVARFFGAGKEKPNLKQLGLYAVLSYGFVSNASYAICVGIAWFASSKKTGLSPLAPDQWQFFLVSYAALFAINNVLRVPRFALSVSLAPAFDRLIAFLMRRTGRGKAFATGLCVFLVNICGTCSLMATVIVLASIFSGVPFWPV